MQLLNTSDVQKRIQYGLGSLLLGVLLIVSTAQATTWRVERDGSGDYLTLQPAADAAAPGDTLLIGPGRYVESSIFPFDNEFGEGETYLGVRVDSLTLIGCHRDSVIIGPDVPDFQGFLPKGIAARFGYVTRLKIENLTVQNVREGIRTQGVTEIRNYHAIGCDIGVLGLLGLLRVFDSQFTGSRRAGVDVGISTGALVEDVVFNDYFLANSIQVIESTNAVFRRCQISGGARIHFSQGSTGTVDSCVVRDAAGAGITAIGSSTIELLNSRFIGTANSLNCLSGSTITGSGNYFGATDPRTMQITDHSIVDLQNCDIALSPIGYTIWLDNFDTSSVFVNLQNNYWGTTDLDSIASEIWDGNDDPNIKTTVLFEPIRDSTTPVRAMSFGELRSLFGAGKQ